MSLFYHIVLITIVHLIHTCFFTTKCKLFSMLFGSVLILVGDMFTLKMLIKFTTGVIVVPLYSQPKISNSIQPNLSKSTPKSSLLPFGQKPINLYQSIKSHIIKNTY